MLRRCKAKSKDNTCPRTLTDVQRQAAYQFLFFTHVEKSLVDEIRSAVNKRMALGDDRFKQEI